MGNIISASVPPVDPGTVEDLHKTTNGIWYSWNLLCPIFQGYSVLGVFPVNFEGFKITVNKKKNLTGCTNVHFSNTLLRSVGTKYFFTVQREKYDLFELMTDSTGNWNVKINLQFNKNTRVKFESQVTWYCNLVVLYFH